MPRSIPSTLEKMAITIGGAVIVALLVWIASSVAGLKESAAAFVGWKSFKDATDARQDRSIEELRIR